MLELYTDRLRLRSLQEQDWPHFLALHQDPDINRYVRIPEAPEVIRQSLSSAQSPGTMPLAIGLR